MDLSKCRKCPLHQGYDITGVFCNYHYGEILEMHRTKNFNYAFILHCPLDKKVTVH